MNQSKIGLPGRHNKHNLNAWHIVFDPDPSCGFAVGTSIDSTLHKNMLAGSCYTPNTILEDPDGIKYRVIFHKNRQDLIKIDG